MRVMVFGANGQVGRELQRAAGPLGVDLQAIDRRECDLAEPGLAARFIRAAAPDAVINAAAYTAVDKAENEPELAARLNSAAPGEMAEAAASIGAPFVHYSTDYVFDGEGTAPYREDHPANPLGVYGRTKYDGEQRVERAGGVHAVIRLSWVFSAHGSNFVKTMLRLGAERDTLRVVADQRGKPTPASAAAVAGLIAARALKDQPGLCGLYHLAGDDATTWADFARAIFAEAGLGAAVEDIETKDYPTPARRPEYSVLDTSKIAAQLGVAAPDWRAELSRVVAALKSQHEGATA